MNPDPIYARSMRNLLASNLDVKPLPTILQKYIGRIFHKPVDSLVSNAKNWASRNVPLVRELVSALLRLAQSPPGTCWIEGAAAGSDFSSTDSSPSMSW